MIIRWVFPSRLSRNTGVLASEFVEDPEEYINSRKTSFGETISYHNVYIMIRNGFIINYI